MRGDWSDSVRGDWRVCEKVKRARVHLYRVGIVARTDRLLDIGGPRGQSACAVAVGRVFPNKGAGRLTGVRAAPASPRLPSSESEEQIIPEMCALHNSLTDNGAATAAAIDKKSHADSAFSHNQLN